MSQHRDLSTQYDIEATVPNVGELMADYHARSVQIADTVPATLDLPYGSDSRQCLDLFVPTGAELSPAQLFFHGGFWRGSSKDDRRFPALVFFERGVAWVPVEYRLAPDVTLDDIVDDARSAVKWIYENGSDHGLDPKRIFVSGNSAGGHLVGMIAADDWQQKYGLPLDVVRGACAVSGLYELDPLRQTFANEWLQLDAAGSARNSPARHLPRSGLPMILSWGGKETDAFKQQSRDYAAASEKAGAKMTAFERTDADHFSIIGEFGDPGSPLSQAIFEQMGI